MNKRKILILGVGNPLRRDDGIGPEIIRLLSEKREPVNPGYDLVDGGTDGLGLIEYFRMYKKVILIDAVEMGLAPGTVKAFTPDEALFHINTDSLSTHGFGIPELIKLARELDVMPRLTIVGIQPEDTQFGEGLSHSVQSAIEKTLGIIRKKVLLF